MSRSFPIALTAMALMFGGCHAHQVAGNHRPESAASAKSAQAHPTKEAPDKRAAAKQSRQVSSARPVRTTPEGFLNAERVRKIQSALSKRGPRVAETGQMDSATQAALVAFQKKNAQPATGFPDFDTLKRLGLEPQQIYLNPSGSKPQ